MTDRVETCRICSGPRPEREIASWESGLACQACLMPPTSEELELAWATPEKASPHLVMRLAFAVHCAGYIARKAQVQ